MNASAKNTHTTRILELYPTEPTCSTTPSAITEVRPGLRQQAKMLRSVSDAILLLCLAAEVILLYVLDTPFNAVFGSYSNLVLGVICAAVAVTSVALASIIRFCASEITEQMKKLNEEV